MQQPLVQSGRSGRDRWCRVTGRRRKCGRCADQHPVRPVQADIWAALTVMPATTYQGRRCPRGIIIVKTARSLVTMPHGCRVHCRMSITMDSLPVNPAAGDSCVDR